MKLYYFPETCAMAPHIALEWIGAEYQLERVERGDNRKPEFLALNPSGQLPVLATDEGAVLTQVPAILFYIAQLNPDAGIGAQINPRAKAGGEAMAHHRMMSRMAHFNSDIHPAFMPFFYPDRYSGDEADHAAIRAKSAERGGNFRSAPDTHLAGRDWVMGEGKSILDTYLYAFCRWARFLPKPVTEYANLTAFAARMNADPGVQAMLEMEGLGQITEVNSNG